MKTVILAIGSFALGILACLFSLWFICAQQAQIEAADAPYAVAWSDGRGLYIECARIDQDGRPTYACSKGGRDE